MDSPEKKTLPLTARAALFWGPVALLALGLAVAGFWLGSRGSGEPDARATASASAKPTPLTTLVPGSYRWDALLGGSCLRTFTGAWQDEFDVVSCATPHVAQVIRVGTVPGYTLTSTPSQDATAAAVLPLCTELGVMSEERASMYPSLVITFTFPTTALEWRHTAGRYACFASTSDSASITGSLLATN